MQVVVGEPVTQVDHPPSCVIRVRALRIFLDHFAQRGEGPTRGLRGALIEVDAEPALQEVRFPLEIGEAFDVVGVVEARMGRVLADEGVRLVERGFGLAAAVVGVDKIEAGLAGLGGERIACDERFVDADRAVEILVVKAAAGALVEHAGRTLGGLVVVLVEHAAGGQRQQEQQQQQRREG